MTCICGCRRIVVSLIAGKRKLHPECKQRRRAGAELARRIDAKYQKAMAQITSRRKQAA